jgi:hypothetical protein
VILAEAVTHSRRWVRPGGPTRRHAVGELAISPYYSGDDGCRSADDQGTILAPVPCSIILIICARRPALGGPRRFPARRTAPSRVLTRTYRTNFRTGRYGNALRVVAFNTAEGWSWDVSEDIALEVLQRVLRRSI